MEKAEKKVYEKPQIVYQQDLETSAGLCPQTSANKDVCSGTGKVDINCYYTQT